MCGVEIVKRQKITMPRNPPHSEVLCLTQILIEEMRGMINFKFES